MRAYSAASEEALHARNLLKDWAGEGYLSEAQYQRTQQDTGCELRRTNIYLRIVLFLFTLLIVGPAIVLCHLVFLSGSNRQTTGIFLLVFAALLYAAAEFAVSEAHLYRYGIEEALAACSVGLLCLGMQFALFSNRSYPLNSNGAEFLIPTAGAIASLWIWHRFGLWYAFAAAMIFVLWLPSDWTPSAPSRHLIVAAFYATGLITVATLRSRHQRYSIVEALLWLGLYLILNIQLSSLSLRTQWWGGPQTTSEFPGTFHWATWILIWCLPPAILARGIQRKDRFVIAVGGIAAILTLVTYKPYLGWRWNSWDPMLLGALLIFTALFIRRWLSEGPDEIRHGFTAKRLSAKDKEWLAAASAALAFVSPQATTPSPQPSPPEVRFGGGDSGGGGATSDF